MPTNYGQTILGSWGQAGAMDLQNQQARALQRENEMAEYDSVTNELITRGILRTDNGIYMDIDKLNELPAGAVANIMQYGLEGTALTKYTGLDKKLKKGKISALTEITEENYDRLQLKNKDGELLSREEVIGKYTVGIKNKRGRMKFIGRGRREGDDTPVLFDSDDISKILDAGAQRMMSKATAGGRTAYGTAAKQKAETDYNRSVTMLGQKMFDEAGRGGQDEEDRIDAQLQEALTKSETDTSDVAPAAASDATATLLNQKNINSKNQDKKIIGDGQKIQTNEQETITRRGQEFPVNVVSEEDRAPKAEINLEGTPKDKNGKHIFRDQTLFGREGARYSTQGKLDAVREEIMGNIGQDQNNPLMTSFGQGWSNNIHHQETRALFKALDLPTKVQDLSSAQGIANAANAAAAAVGQPSIVKGPWEKALEELDRIQGIVDGEVPTTDDQTGPETIFPAATEEAKTEEEAQTVVTEKIDKQVKPEPEEVLKLRELLEANEVKTLDDYMKIARKELSPNDLIAANWIVASIGTKSMAEVQKNMTMLTNITQTGDPGYSYKEMMDDKNTAYANVTARMKEISAQNAKNMTDPGYAQLVKDIAPVTDLRENYTMDMDGGTLTDKDGNVLSTTQYKEKMSLTIENLRRSLRLNKYSNANNRVHAQKELDITYAHYLSLLAAKQETVRMTGDWFGDVFRRYPTPHFVDGGLKNMRIRNTRKGAMIVFGTTNYKGDFDETDNSVLAGGAIREVFGSDAEFMKFIERNQIRDANTGKVWSRPKKK